VTRASVVERVAELQAWADAARAAGARIALVPTMGALHAGHLALVREARRRADRVVVSIFVNPTQFGPGEDLARYPRPFERDLALCREAGVDVVFAPAAGELYPPGAQTWVEVAELARPLCGRDRPGHFRGVATVVVKLLAAAKPHIAVFGEKDFQQLALVRRLAADLLFDVEIVGVPIVREADGLALSSRNVHLDREMRAEALVLSRSLDAAQAALAGGVRGAAALLALVGRELAKAPHASVDYAELRDPGSLAPAPARLEGPTLLVLAVRFPVRRADDPAACVRLIDNRLLHPPDAEDSQ
jgi:pantoate--beta-alanine ligase